MGARLRLPVGWEKLNLKKLIIRRAYFCLRTYYAYVLLIPVGFGKKQKNYRWHKTRHNTRGSLFWRESYSLFCLRPAAKEREKTKKQELRIHKSISETLKYCVETQKYCTRIDRLNLPILQIGFQAVFALAYDRVILHM